MIMFLKSTLGEKKNKTMILCPGHDEVSGTEAHKPLPSNGGSELIKNGLNGGGSLSRVPNSILQKRKREDSSVIDVTNEYIERQELGQKRQRQPRNDQSDFMETPCTQGRYFKNQKTSKHVGQLKHDKNHRRKDKEEEEGPDS